MKIYQVYEYGGEYECRYDYIIKSFMSKEKAEEFMKECEAAEEEMIKLRDKCYGCICYHRDFEKFNNFNELINDIKNYCDKFELDDEDAKEEGIDITESKNFDYIECQNSLLYEWFDYPSFEVEEVEVEE